MAKKKVEELTIEEKLNNSIIPVDKQPYKIPPNWCWVKINSISNIYTGNSINEKVKAEKYINNSKGLLYIATKDIDFDSYINYETNVRISDYENFKIAPANTSLLCIEGGSAGRKVGFVDRCVCFVNKLCAFTPKKINSKYIYYYLKTNYFSNQFNLKKHGLIGGVSLKDLININFPLPPLAEQERIVSKLDDYISKLNEAKEKLEKVVDTYEFRKSVILHKAFTGQLTKNWRKENKFELDDDIKKKAITKDSMLPDEYLYEIPENWSWVRLGNIGEIVTGSTPNTKEKSYFGGNVPFIKPAELDQEENIISSAETLTEKGKNISRPVRKGSTCICCIGTIGKCGFLRVEAVTNQQINTVIPYDFLDDLFVYYYCCSKFFKKVIRERSCATTIYIINKTKTSKLPFPLPPLEEQKEIVKILDSFLTKEKQVKEIAEKEIERLENLRENLLARAFGGVLGTNDPNEENSIELLKSVL